MQSLLWYLHLILQCLLDAASCAPPSSSVTNRPTVVIDSGPIVGIRTILPDSKVSVNKFLGVPFAAPPVRFGPPTSPEPWSTPFDASNNGPACIQQFSYPEESREFNMRAFNTPPPPESEDCLSINIYTPTSACGGSHEKNELKPVMFWVYGGSLEFGYNGLATYDGTSFAAHQDIVLVAANYRTNIFGFPNAPSLPDNHQNLGFLDQHLALDWVQRNIKAFGGDPCKVTLIGESAGGASVDSLVLGYQSNPPFRGAIMESGQGTYNFLTGNTPNPWETLISKLNCSSQGFGPSEDLACARAAPASTLKSIEEHLALVFHAFPDNVTYFSTPAAITARQAGHVAHVPVLYGSNANEGGLFTVGLNDTDAFLDNLLPNMTDLQDAVRSTYSVGSILAGNGTVVENDYQQITAIFTDIGFTCTTSLVANLSATSGAHVPTYRYFYNATFPNIQPVPGLSIGAYHSSEIPMVFGTYGLYQENGGPTEQEKQLSREMQTLWADFARDPEEGLADKGWLPLPQVEVLGTIEGEPGKLRAGKTSYDVGDGRCQVFKKLLEGGA